MRVILDEDLATLYGVPTKQINQQVRRNPLRFPPDFMLRLTWEETHLLRSQNVTLEKGKGRHRKHPPLAFTEHGVAMLSSVLKSEQAVQLNIAIVRAFVAMRAIVQEHKDLVKKLDALEKDCDERFRAVFRAIRALMEPLDKPRRKIGFET